MQPGRILHHVALIDILSGALYPCSYIVLNIRMQKRDIELRFALVTDAVKVSTTLFVARQSFGHSCA
jgi:hypothetical protein